MVVFNEQKQNDRIAKLRDKNEEQLIQALSKKYGVGYVDLSGVSINTDALRLIPEAKARDAKIAAFDIKGRKIALGIVSPFPDIVKKEIKELEDKKYKVSLFMISKKSLDKAWSRYGDVSYAVKTEKGVIDISSSEIEDVLKHIETLPQAVSLIKNALESNKAYRISKIIELVLYSAYALGSSDIHIEPAEDFVGIRFRIDGILTPVINIDFATYNRILSRIKLTAGLKINVRQNAQDGRFSIKMGEEEMEIRTSTLPDAYGESVVLRILDPRAISVPLESLGMLPYFLEIVQKQLDRPNGMILNTGPTGSGKSTTLFGFLKKIRKPGIKILTIENPIEYHVEGIVQTQVNKDKGYTFLSGLRAALRQDPDVVMVGEIRDSETASVATNAALTGHLVLSTLHTNSAAGTFARLLDLKVNPKVVSTAVNLVIAQRLVRKLCPHCKKKKNINSSSNKRVREMIKNIYSSIKNKEKYIEDPKKEKIIYRPNPKGCQKCNSSGYKGRMGIFEAILMDERLEEVLKSDPTERDIYEGTRHQGILSLRQDGVIKILNGDTSIDEVQRVISLREF